MVDNVASSSSASSSQPICALCSSPARYKCPRCTTPTCSLPCSRRHKQNSRCSGERDKAQYVPMNAYNWGIMMRDYCYLEEIGRKVGEWGNEIVRGGYTESVGTGKAATARRSANGRKPTTGKSKRELLRVHLDALGIDVELLPVGMERRALNQSTFDQKSKCPLLTIEFVLYPPTTLAVISSSPPQSHRILSHRNALSATLLAVLQRQVALTPSKTHRQKENVPEWLPSIITPHPEAPECFVPPRCYIRANTDLSHAPNVAYYHKLEPTRNLGELLQRTSFVEFPTIHVFDPDASSFCGTVIDKSGTIVRTLEDDQFNTARAVKRRRLNKAAGLKTVANLVGGYGSESSSRSHSEEEISNKHMTGLATLEAYSGTDEEINPTGSEVEEGQSRDSENDATAENDQLNPTRLLELMKQARGAADEDVLDWGDEWDIDAEERGVKR